MEAFEITAHRIGGSDSPGFPRSYGWVAPLDTNENSETTVQLQPYDGMSYMELRVEFSQWEKGPADGWMGVSVKLVHMNGQPIGLRPALVFTGSSDVPTYVTFFDVQCREVFTVGVRRYRK